jgi:hypothetical protein
MELFEKIVKFEDFSRKYGSFAIKKNFEFWRKKIKTITFIKWFDHPIYYWLFLDIIKKKIRNRKEYKVEVEIGFAPPVLAHTKKV